MSLKELWCQCNTPNSVTTMSWGGKQLWCFNFCKLDFSAIGANTPNDCRQESNLLVLYSNCCFCAVMLCRICGIFIIDGGPWNHFWWGCLLLSRCLPLKKGKRIVGLYLGLINKWITTLRSSFLNDVKPGHLISVNRHTCFILHLST